MFNRRAELPKMTWVRQGDMSHAGGVYIELEQSKPSFGSGNVEGTVTHKAKNGDPILIEGERALWIEASVAINDEAKFLIKEYERHEKGSRAEGTARWVWEFVGADSGLPFRAGLTIHLAKGTWSSLPHDFEVEHMQTLKPMAFDERFFFITQPAHSWGIVARFGHLYVPGQGQGVVTDTVVVRDGDSLSIPLGYHPVTGGPGVRMGYLWAYTCADLSRMEKFAND